MNAGRIPVLDHYVERVGPILKFGRAGRFACGPRTDLAPGGADDLIAVIGKCRSATSGHCDGGIASTVGETTALVSITTLPTLAPAVSGVRNCIVVTEAVPYAAYRGR